MLRNIIGYSTRTTWSLCATVAPIVHCGNRCLSRDKALEALGTTKKSSVSYCCARHSPEICLSSDVLRALGCAKQVEDDLLGTRADRRRVHSSL